jgi:hypothetical protein
MTVDGHFRARSVSAAGNLIGGTNGELATCGNFKPATAADCSGAAASATGTALSDIGTVNSLRIGTGTGVNTSGSPRQIEWGLKLSF